MWCDLILSYHLIIKNKKKRNRSAVDLFRIKFSQVILRLIKLKLNWHYHLHTYRFAIMLARGEIRQLPDSC